MNINIAIFASGSGSNAIQLLNHFEKTADINIKLLLTNNKNAGVLAKTQSRVKQLVIDNEQAQDGEQLSQLMREHKIDYIVLAGYLRKIPLELIKAYPQHIINIHPALLPKYGGKGMYGMNVHRAVHENKETQSGITIHLVNEVYDDGETLAQHTVDLTNQETPETIQKKVLAIEHQYFPSEVERYIREQNK